MVSSTAAQTTWHVNDSCGDDSWSGLSPICEAPDGPKKTIQAAMNLGQTGDTVLVADGVYTGPGNKGLFFPGLSNFTVRSQGGPQNCTIDLENSGLAFFLVDDETPQAVVRGFTIRNGNSCDGGAFYLHHSSQVTIAECILTNNWSSVAGGAIMADTETSPTIINCRIRDNASAGSGGAIAFFNDSSAPRIINCEITNNTAMSDGGALFFFGDDSPLLINTTIANNVAAGQGSGIFNPGISDITIANSILWGNSGCQIAGAGGANVTFSNVQGGWLGVGNINANPLFVDATNGDFRLMSGSPCIDAGDNTAVPMGITKDIRGKPRFLDDPFTPDTGNGTPPIVDMGAFEFFRRYRDARGLPLPSASSRSVR